MLGRFKDTAVTVISKNSHKNHSVHDNQASMKKPSVKRGSNKPEKYVFARPYFLGLDKDEVQVSQDFGLRPILKPRKIQDVPLMAGYAECINGGKSNNNEDNSYACDMCIKAKPVSSEPAYRDIGYLKSMERTLEQEPPKLLRSTMEAVYFGMFDGHAGFHTSLISSRCLHTHLQDQLSLHVEEINSKESCVSRGEFDTVVQKDELVIGALEQAFQLMDDQLKKDSEYYSVHGGCTALTVLFLNKKIYVANAGDSRAVFCHGSEVKQVSKDFTPDSERQRIYDLGNSHPELLHGEFSSVEFVKRPTVNNLGTKMLCKKSGCKGWSYKVVEDDDLKFPLVVGNGKNTRIMATIGVSRGLGDHDLYVYDSDVWIKPFLSSLPEVQIIDLEGKQYNADDVLIMGTDGLWDVITNLRAVEIVRSAIASVSKDNKDRYTIAAQELVAEARGIFTGQGWKKQNGMPASFDDISAFVIPVYMYAHKNEQNQNPIKEDTGNV